MIESKVEIKAGERTEAALLYYLARHDREGASCMRAGRLLAANCTKARENVLSLGSPISAPSRHFVRRTAAMRGSH